MHFISFAVLHRILWYIKMLELKHKSYTKYKHATTDIRHYSYFISDYNGLNLIRLESFISAIHITVCIYNKDSKEVNIAIISAICMLNLESTLK